MFWDQPFTGRLNLRKKFLHQLNFPTVSEKPKILETCRCSLIGTRSFQKSMSTASPIVHLSTVLRQGDCKGLSDGWSQMGRPKSCDLVAGAWQSRSKHQRKEMLWVLSHGENDPEHSWAMEVWMIFAISTFWIFLEKPRCIPFSASSSKSFFRVCSERKDFSNSTSLVRSSSNLKCPWNPCQCLSHPTKKVQQHTATIHWVTFF